MKKSIVVSNIYGKYNLGDYAIRNSGIKLLNKAYKGYTFHLLCESIYNFKIDVPKNMSYDINYSPYGYSIDTDKRPKNKLSKLTEVILIILVSIAAILLEILFKKWLPNKGFYKYVNMLRSSNLVVLMGGGYFITKNKYSDFFGVILNVIPIYIAKLYKKEIIVLPISFGPFANSLHEKIIGNALKGTKTYSRDKISLSYIKKYNSRAIYVPDLALFEWKPFKKVIRKKYYVITVKDYLNKNRQMQVEHEIAKYINIIWEKYKLHCVFIPTGANPIEENDLPVGERLKKIIHNEEIFSINLPKSPDETKKIMRQAKFAVCTRMHSAIFALLEYTPFIAIAYEHKTIGLLESLNLNKWYINMNDITHEALLNLTNILLTEKNINQVINNYIKQRTVVLSYYQFLEKDLFK